MTAPELLMQYILNHAIGIVYDDPKVVAELFSGSEEIWDVMEEFRSGEHNTGLEADYSHNYESRAVASKMLDGRYVGWTYFFGGGKHGEPGEMPWIKHAYFVEMKEVLEPVKKFTKVKNDRH